MLEVLNGLVDRGASFTFLIRVPASVADVASAWLLFELLRLRCTASEAALAAITLAASPLLIIVSGFHGNTDPVFVAFSLLAVYVLGAHDRTFWGGLTLATALSIKLVPVVLLPMMIVLCVRRGGRRLLRFCAGGLVVFLVLWVPVLLRDGRDFLHQVLFYSGIPFTQWGVPQFLHWARHEHGYYLSVLSHTGPVMLLVAALIPALLVWEAPHEWMLAAGLGFPLFLLLSPAFGMQYLVWPLAAAYLVNGLLAAIYNMVASVFAWLVYSDWSGRWWGWNEAHGLPFTTTGLVLMCLTWCTLLLVVLYGLGSAVRAARGQSGGPVTTRSAVSTHPDGAGRQ
jgi:uncharacterized membrane protein